MKPQEGLRDLRRSAATGCLLLVVFAAIYSWQSWREVNDRDQRQMESLVEVSARSLDIFFTNLEGSMRSAGETSSSPTAAWTRHAASRRCSG